jgi:hypothetical protein
MLRQVILASAVALPFGLPILSASAAMPATEQDYVPKHAIPIDKAGVVHHGPLDCVTARKIVREEGYQDVKARDCNGETYSFRADRNGHSVHLRVDRESGRITRG